MSESLSTLKSKETGGLRIFQENLTYLVLTNTETLEREMPHAEDPEVCVWGG